MIFVYILPVFSFFHFFSNDDKVGEIDKLLEVRDDERK